MRRRIELWGSSLPVVGVVHLLPLPGSPGHDRSLSQIENAALRDAEALAAGGVDALIVENFGDRPFFPSRVPPETVACMAVIARAIRSECHLPLGINVLRNDAFSALAIAEAVGAAFIRVNVFTGARLTDQGVVEGEAHEIVRYRRALGSDAMILADVGVKHSVPIADVPIGEEVSDALSRGAADAVIVTGAATGAPADSADLAEARAAAGEAPVLVGSGVNPDTLDDLTESADGFIVGSFFKEEGDVMRPVDADRVRMFMQVLDSLRP